MTSWALPTANGLYDESLPPVIEGSLPQEARRVVVASDGQAEAKVSNFLIRHGIGRKVPKVPYIVDPIEPDGNGVVNGYTNGQMIGLNPCIIPENSFFYNFTRKLRESKNPLSKYIESKLSKPVTNLIDTIVHEKLHIATQMKERYAEDGSRTNFLNDLYGATVQYFSEKLPRPLKPLSKYLAGSVFIPMVEGLNQAATYQAKGFDSNEQIKSEAVKSPTAYDRVFTPAATDSLEKMSLESPGKFYDVYHNSNSSQAYRSVMEYVGGFVKSLGKYISAQPQAAYACSTA